MTDKRTRYTFEGWQAFFTGLTSALQQDVLRHAQLPLDLFSRKSITLSADEFFRLWDGLAFVKRDEPTLPLRMVQTLSTETLSPVMFATVSSSDLNTALTRISRYKPLVGPVRLKVEQTHHETRAVFTGVSQDDSIPDNLAVLELAFWVHIARIATREHIVPKAVHMIRVPPDLAAHEAFFDCPITISPFNALVFSSVDAQRPFLTTNHAIWSILEPELNRRLQDLSRDSLFSDRVRACLVEMLASGSYSMTDVAAKLAMSNRTLHRRLKEENTTFQNVLDQLREELARHYLAASHYSTAQIAFLLGYEESNSFYRAFRAWTGQTPDAVRGGVGLHNLQPEQH